MPALIRQARQMRIRGELVAAVGTIAPSVIQVAGEAANGIVGADIYFPDVEPFASNPGQPSLRAPRAGDVHSTTPDKYMALGATALQVWAMAAKEVKSLGPRGGGRAHPRRHLPRHDHGRGRPSGRTASSSRATRCSRCRSGKIVGPAVTGRRGAGRRPMLRVEGLGVRYGALVALDDVSWEVAARRDPRHHRAERRRQELLLRRRRPTWCRRSGRVFLDGAEVTDAPPHALAELRPEARLPAERLLRRADRAGQHGGGAAAGARHAASLASVFAPWTEMARAPRARSGKPRPCCGASACRRPMHGRRPGEPALRHAAHALHRARLGHRRQGADAGRAGRRPGRRGHAAAARPARRAEGGRRRPWSSSSTTWT